jgi:uncharacterized protein (DUF885 family)
MYEAPIGSIEIRRVDDGLAFTFGALQGRLQHWHHDTFRGHFGSYGDRLVTFSLNSERVPSKMNVEFIGDFSRVRAPQLNALAHRFVTIEVAHDPTLVYQLGVPHADHSTWPDRSRDGIRRHHAASDELLLQLRAIPTETLAGRARTLHAAMVEKLESRRQARICRFELWSSISHVGGWHSELASVAEEQPVSTAAERAQALERWAAVPQLVDVEIANARAGLAAGYSSPKTVVQKVIAQLDRITFDSPATRSDDEGFKKAFSQLLDGTVASAMRRYRTFLAEEYLPRARKELGLAAHPDGAACYAASLRAYTTLERTPKEVYEAGLKAVAANEQRVRELGGLHHMQEIARRMDEAPENRFRSEEELLTFSRAVVARAREKSRALFAALPTQPLLVEPLPAFQRGAGATPHYEPSFVASKPAYYRINPDGWKTTTKAAAEITAAHEAYPGHHVQLALAYAPDAPAATKLLSNSAYVEGWGRYAEQLAEEAGIYETPYAQASRRLWPGRGMVADPGLHVFGWSTGQVVDYFVASGRFSASEASAIVDRMSVLPGQLTAYDSGALEIVALREEARVRLGERFSLPAFHQQVLENGPLPLRVLRENVREWLARAPAASP